MLVRSSSCRSFAICTRGTWELTGLRPPSRPGHLQAGARPFLDESPLGPIAMAAQGLGLQRDILVRSADPGVPHFARLEA
jgi:hypothetical protein